jgi:beta-xylosidase
LRTRGWSDPCPFWDDDGKAYLVSSHPNKRWFGYLFQMTPDGSKLLDADGVAMNSSDGPYQFPTGGTLISPFQSTEGNKIFKRNGYYYLQHIEFLDKGHGRGTYIMRSKNMYGTRADGTPGKPGDPGQYDILKFGEDLPGQGGFVDTPDGRWFWIGQFNHSPNSDGRMPNLIPVTWIDDWPVPGVDVHENKGKFAWQLSKPIENKSVVLPQRNDEFDGQTLNPQWMWDHQPRPDKWSLSEHPGYLRLYAFKQVQPGRFFKTGNVLSQRHYRSDLTVATIKLDLSGMADGQEAGLANFNGGKNYSSLKVVQKSGVRSIQYQEDGKITLGNRLPDSTTTVWIRSSAGFDDINTYSCSLDGKTFTPSGSAYKLKSAGWRGDMIGIYTFNNDAEKGYIDVDYFHYETTNK